jgi:hypothetical protein
VDGGDLYGDGRRGMKREADGYGGGGGCGGIWRKEQGEAGQAGQREYHQESVQVEEREE